MTRTIGLLFTLTVASAAELPRLRSLSSNLPLSFEPNRGQTDARVQYVARGKGYALFLTRAEAVLSLSGGKDQAVVRLKPAGANRHARMEALDPQPGKSNYFIGNDPKQWRTDVPNFGRVRYDEVYPGVDLVYYGNQRELEYDWIVKPGADAGRIGLVAEGVESLRVGANGDLVLRAGGEEVRQRKPVVYQEVEGGRKAVGGRYVLRGRNRIGFEVAGYDHSKPLVIDPVLLYSSYLGGIGEDVGNGIAVDGSGNAYVTGWTSSTNFPTANPFQASFGGGSANAFVTKINAAGLALVYSTYLGGSGNDVGVGIAVDDSGNAYVTGYTASTNFPTANPLQASNGGLMNAFVTKVNSLGSTLLYSTYLGGGGPDRGNDIAVDGSGNAYVTGYTASTNFPTANPLQASFGGNANTFVSTFVTNAFVTKINAAGLALVYSTYLGGSGGDVGLGIAVDGVGNAYVTGVTNSTNFPTTNAMQASNGGTQDAFVAKINSLGSTLLYSTYLGGTANDTGYAIAVDGSGNAYVTGSTYSTNFPTTNPLQASNGGSQNALQNAFVTKINAVGSARLYSTYLGGSGGDEGNGIAVDGSGNAYVTGWTFSTNFPTANALQASIGGSSGSANPFVTKINATGSALVYSTYLGGDGSGGDGGDFGNGIAADGSGNAYVTGYTGSTNFPTTNPFQASSAGNGDAFVLSISGNSPLAAFRDSSGAVWLSSELSTSLSNSSGAFASDPSAAQDPSGNTFLVACDTSNALWVNEFHAQGRTLSGWTLAGGAVIGEPAIAVTATGAAFFLARDASHAYWLNSYTPGTGFGGWIPLGGAFATDPAIAATRTCPSNICTVYLAGKDNFNAIWTSTYSVPGGFSGWSLQGAVVNGTPSLTVGVDGAAYIGVRDLSNSIWMGRQAGTTFNGWQPGGGAITVDPQVAGSDGKVYAVALASGGVVWYNTFTEGTGNNWTGWTSPGGTLASVTAAASTGPQLFFAGRDPSNQLWWYETPGSGWKYLGYTGLAAGPLSAAPR